MPMQENYLYDELVQFLYHDTTTEEAEKTAKLLKEDPDVLEQFDRMLTAKNLLPKAHFDPAPAVITNILQYSTKTALEAQL
ncbi:MAG: hypothetical protein ABMA02_00600 [Saprospiraceae bacterium]